MEKSRSGSGATEGLRRKLGVHRTLIVRVRPTTTAGELTPEYRIVATRAGVCHPGSSLVTAEVYECSTGSQIYQPCWPSRQRRSVYCLLKPWLHEVSEVRVEGVLSRGGPAEGGPLPWGLELTSGTRCETNRGAPSKYRDKVVRFSCPGDMGLLEQPVQDAGLWRIRSVRDSNKQGTLTDGVEVYVKVAWYGVANGGPMPPA